MPNDKRATYNREEALRLASRLALWRQTSAHAAADQLRAAVAEIDRLTAPNEGKTP